MLKMLYTNKKNIISLLLSDWCAREIQ